MEMFTFQDLMLFGTFLIALLAYIDRKNRRKKLFQVTGQTLTKSKNEYTKQLLSDMGKLLGIIHFLSVGLRTLVFLLVEKFAEEVLRLRQWQDEDPGLSEQCACL